MTTLLALAATAGACSGPTSDARPEPDPPEHAGGETDALLPRAPGDLSPAHVRVDGGEIDLTLLADVESCETCHADAAEHWRGSAHGRSSFDNPWYRGAVEVFRKEVGDEQSRFCAGCHDPLMIVTGRIDREIDPADPIAHAGITCMVCHGITETTSDGNASYTLSTAPVPMPRPNDPASLRAHVEHVTPDPLRTAGLCGSCHRGFLGEHSGNAHFLPGMDDAGPWRASAYAGSEAAVLDDPVEQSKCQDCHMADAPAPHGDAAAANGLIRSHRFAGGQTALAAQQSEAQLRAVREQLERAATIDVAALVHDDGRRALPADGAEVRAGETVALEVVIRNEGAGHRFPGGVRDTHDTWVELTVRTRDGERVAGAGDRHADRDDDTAHRLITMAIDEHGRPELAHLVQRFRAIAWDHTVPPRDARVVRYELALPTDLPDAAFPLRVQAVLRHRRHVRPMHELACEAVRSPRGRQFTAGARAAGKTPIDGCQPQPVTDIARAVVWIGAGAEGRRSEGGADRPAWRRLWAHALGLSHDVQERVDDARPSLARAVELLGADREADPDRARAMLLAIEAALDSRQGRVDDAIADLDAAEALVGEHPALSRIRGEASARVWRWPAAAAAFDVTARLAPEDTAAWRDLARARGSAGDDELALAATVRGLAMLPRDEALLRSQMLSLERLGRPGAADARSAFLLHRHPDDASDLRLLCERTIEDCHRNRQPVPRITMRTY